MLKHSEIPIITFHNTTFWNHIYVKTPGVVTWTTLCFQFVWGFEWLTSGLIMVQLLEEPLLPVLLVSDIAPWWPGTATEICNLLSCWQQQNYHWKCCRPVICWKGTLSFWTTAYTCLILNQSTREHRGGNKTLELWMIIIQVLAKDFCRINHINDSIKESNPPDMK